MPYLQPIKDDELWWPLHHGTLHKAFEYPNCHRYPYFFRRQTHQFYIAVFVIGDRSKKGVLTSLGAVQQIATGKSHPILPTSPNHPPQNKCQGHQAGWTKNGKFRINDLHLSTTKKSSNKMFGERSCSELWGDLCLLFYVAFHSLNGLRSCKCKQSVVSSLWTCIRRIGN